MLNATKAPEIQIIYYFEVTAFSIALVLTFTLNSLVLVVFIRRVRRRGGTITLLLTNLAACQELVGIFVIPFVIISIIYDKWKYITLLCKINGFTTSTIFYASVFSLCLVSIDRLFAILWAMRYRSILTRKRGKLMIATVWILAAVFSTPPLVGWSSYRYSSGTLHCSPTWMGNCSYYYFVFILAVVLPLSVTCISYTLIFYKVRKQRIRITMLKSGKRLGTDQREPNVNSSHPSLRYDQDVSHFSKSNSDDEQSQKRSETCSGKDDVKFKASFGGPHGKGLMTFTLKQKPKNTAYLKAMKNRRSLTCSTVDNNQDWSLAQQKKECAEGRTLPSLKMRRKNRFGNIFRSLDVKKGMDDLTMPPAYVQQQQSFKSSGNPRSALSTGDLRDSLTSNSSESDTRVEEIASARGSVDDLVHTIHFKRFVSSKPYYRFETPLKRNLSDSTLNGYGCLPGQCSMDDWRCADRAPSTRIRKLSFLRRSLNKKRFKSLGPSFLYSLDANSAAQRKELTEQRNGDNTSDFVSMFTCSNTALRAPGIVIENSNNTTSILLPKGKDEVKQDESALPLRQRQVLVKEDTMGSKTIRRKLRKTRSFNREYQVAKTGFILVVTFCICYGPYALVNRCHEKFELGEWAQHTAMWCVFLYSVLSPVIYGLKTKDVREEIHRLCLQVMKR